MISTVLTLLLLYKKDAANKGWNVLGTCAKDTSHKSTNVNSYKVTGPTVLALGTVYTIMFPSILI